MPESLGLAAGAVYIITLLLMMPMIVKGADFVKLGEFTATLLSVCSMVLVGFVDDVIDLKWRYKILLPAIAATPLLILYRMTGGNTHVLLPPSYLLELGPLYYAYMLMFVTFCTHSINILAGVNGVEVGQTMVIACFALLHNLICIFQGYKTHEHYHSLLCLAPFIAVCGALLKQNWFPAQVFVGDTFCYFGGMTLAVAGILGHYSKTMMILFIPQVFNFIISLPQLFRLVHCPRHRLPRIGEDGRLHPSVTTIDKESYIVKLYLRLGLSQRRGEKEVTNFTLLNVLLLVLGPLREDHLAMAFLGLQTTSCSVALFIRHYFPHLLFAK